jgi:hypothetical protein
MATFINFLGKPQELDPEFKPITAAAALAKFKAIADNAGYRNMTPEEYLISRGGINRSGIFGDSYGINNEDGVSLTDEELDPLRGAGGDVRNAALAKKIFEKTGKLPKWWGNQTPGYNPTLGVTPATAQAAADKAAADKAAADKAAADASAAAAKVAADAAARATTAATTANMSTTDGFGFSLPGYAKDAIGGAGITGGAVTPATDAEQKKAAADAAKATQERQSIITILTDRFAKYNLGGLASKIKDLAIDGATEATITIGLQETDEYKTRFSANQDRMNRGLKVLSPAEYLNLEDGYRQVLRAYGLSQFDNDTSVKQFISNDVSAAELSDRVVMAVQRVQNADPEVARTLRDYYNIGSGDMLAYVLDPNQELPKIQRQIAAAEIGTAARRQGLEAGVTVADQLAAQGISQAEAQKGYATIADILPTAEKLSSIYGTTMSGYGQSEAEQEVFNSLASAQRKRTALSQREIAAFSGSSGLTSKTLASETRGQI